MSLCFNIGSDPPPQCSTKILAFWLIFYSEITCFDTFISDGIKKTTPLQYVNVLLGSKENNVKPVCIQNCTQPNHNMHTELPSPYTQYVYRIIPILHKVHSELPSPWTQYVCRITPTLHTKCTQNCPCPTQYVYRIIPTLHRITSTPQYAHNYPHTIQYVDRTAPPYTQYVAGTYNYATLHTICSRYIELSNLTYNM